MFRFNLFETTVNLAKNVFQYLLHFDKIHFGWYCRWTKLKMLKFKWTNFYLLSIPVYHTEFVWQARQPALAPIF